MPLQLEGMSSRKRRPNWTDQECLFLAQLMQEKKDIIRGKCSTGVSIQDKRQAWEDIAKAINTAFPQIQRTISDCNKKWENLLAKSREEIKRHRRQVGTGLSLEQFSTVTQVVISVMNLSDMLQQDKKDSSVLEMVKTQQNSCDENGNEHTVDEQFSQMELPVYLDPSTSPVEQKISAFTDVKRFHAAHFCPHHAPGSAASEGHLDSPCTATPPSAHCKTFQERNNLEMSVLRRQETVLKLQEEYYSLKINLIKKQMEAQLSKD
ncbi:myb-related transcription factor, partner of profilin-like isoform X2 [Centropristis striata]|uniref:myb-related transcription factor, partner of profilin-like isoform X2 n=1 Tax=Centropristis striata TaxID=184440 RepID=UPI0027E1DB96|nr:myb-related transcription factor, partner of profilin-like isoform X2 [Centropristis striata]